jgi:hypothetical protein
MPNAVTAFWLLIAGFDPRRLKREGAIFSGVPCHSPGEVTKIPAVSTGI